MDTYILAGAESRIRQLEADVRQLKRLEELRCLSAEQGQFLRKSTMTVLGAMTALGLLFVILSKVF
jgi:hypothetical protein